MDFKSIPLTTRARYLYHLVRFELALSPMWGALYHWAKTVYWYVLEPKPYAGLEPATSGLEVPRAIHCANRAVWVNLGLNQGPSDLQSDALPTKLFTPKSSILFLVGFEPTTFSMLGWRDDQLHQRNSHLFIKKHPLEASTRDWTEDLGITSAAQYHYAMKAKILVQ